MVFAHSLPLKLDLHMLVNNTITVSSELCEADLNEISNQLEQQQTLTACRNFKMVLRRTRFIDE